ncbi:trehalase family glycosidase [Stenotrophomonas bentonitica]
MGCSATSRTHWRGRSGCASCARCRRCMTATASWSKNMSWMAQPAVGGGGEYPLQDGFGWSNGVTLALMDRLCPPKRQCETVDDVER